MYAEARETIERLARSLDIDVDFTEVESFISDEERWGEISFRKRMRDGRIFVQKMQFQAGVATNDMVITQAKDTLHQLMDFITNTALHND